MNKLWLFVLFPSLAFAQVQIQGKPGGAVQIGGNQPGVSSIQGATGDFTYTGSGFAGCSTASGITTCTFTGGGTNNSTSGAQCYVGDGALVGAFTDGSGIYKQALCVGKSQVSFTVPQGATQLQLGIDDDLYADNTGSFSINVSKNGGATSPVTVAGNVMPWSPSTNPVYTFGMNDGASPVVALTGLTQGDSVTIAYQSGTVRMTGSYPLVDADGYLTTPPGPATGGGPTASALSPTSTYYPTKYMTTGFASGAITGLTGDGTATGPGVVPFTLANSGVSAGSYTSANITVDAKGRVTAASNGSGGGGIPGGTNGQLQYNNSSAFGGDTGSTTDGAGNVTTKTLSTTGTVAGQGGTWNATEGTAPSAAAGHDLLYADSTSHCIKYSANGGSFACLGAAAGTVTTTGSPASGNLTKFSGASSITNGDLSGDVTTAGTLATTLANTAVTPGSYTSANITVDSKGRVTAAANGSGGGGTPSGTNGVIQIANTGGTAFDSDSTIAIDKTNHKINVGTLGSNFASIGALGTPTAWNFDTTSPATAALSLGSGTAATHKYVDGAAGAWTSLPFVSLTTTGTSGVATLSGGVLNIPQYTVAGGYPTPVTTNVTSAASEIDITSAQGCITSTYSAYQIRFTNVKIAAGSGTIQPGIQFGLSGTWDTASDYKTARAFAEMQGGTSAGTDGGHTGTGIVPTLTNTDTNYVVGNYFNGIITVHLPLTAQAAGQMGEIQTTTQLATLSNGTTWANSGGFTYTNSATANTLTFDSVRVIALSGTGVTFTGKITCQPLPE